jgi:RES domain-containing protein
MIRVWRVSKARHASGGAAAFDGEGARRRGGRWNQAGIRVAYSSSSLALAALEYFVNIEPNDAPTSLVFVEAIIPDGVKMEHLALATLPEGWDAIPAPVEIQRLGDRWALAGDTVALIVPSVIIPRETNILINSEHVDFKRLQFGTPEAFRFDPRMWKA